MHAHPAVSLPIPAHPCTTLSDAWRQFERDATDGVALNRNRRPYKSSTIAEYHYALRNPAVAHLLDRPIDDITRVDVQRALDAAARAGVSGSRRRSIATALRALWRWGQLRGLCERHAIQGIETPAAEPIRQRPLAPTEADDVLRCFGDPTVRACYAAALYAGARSQEVAALTWRDVDVERRILHLGLDPRARKSRAAQRTVPIVDALRPHLEAAWHAQRAPDGPAALVPGGMPPRERAAWFRRRGAKALLGTRWAELKPHYLRHSWASWMLAAGVPLPAVRDLMGHESGASVASWAAGVTLDVYGHSLSGHVDQARVVMNAWLEQHEHASSI